MTNTFGRTALLIALFNVVGCTSTLVRSDGSMPDRGASTADGFIKDSGKSDTGQIADAGKKDAGYVDVGSSDSGSTNLRDKTVTHGREITPAHVGPHATPKGTTYNAPHTISTAGTYSNLVFNKGLTISANNVELFDCYIGTDVTSSSFNVRVLGSNVKIHHCEIDNHSKVYYAIEHSGGSAGARNSYYRNWIHHAGQCLSSGSNYFDFYENYCTDIVAPNPAPYPGDDGWHADGVIAWGEHLTVKRNKILCRLQQTGVINIGTWVGMPAHNVTDVVVDANYFAGAGYIFYIEERGVSDVLNMTITDNDIGRDFYPNGGFYGVWYGGAPPVIAPTTSGNRLVEVDGAFVSNINWPF